MENGRAKAEAPIGRGCRPEIALGNISGTVVHFAALNAGIIAIVKPLTLGADTTRFYLPVAVASPAIFAGVLVVLLLRSRGKNNRLGTSLAEKEAALLAMPPGLPVGKTHAAD